MVAPASFSHLMPCCQRASISSESPSMRYSFGMPIFMPFTPLRTSCRQFGVLMFSEVESFGSWLHITSRRMALSSTVLAIGPA